MPRVNIIPNLIKQISNKQILKSKLKIVPKNINLFCSEQQGENLLQQMDDIKNIKNINQMPKFYKKMFKTRLTLEFSAKDAQKLALSSNQIGNQQKCFVLNKNMLIENQNKQKQTELILQQINNQYLNNFSLQLKLKQAFRQFKVKNVSSAPSLNDKWILDTPQLSKQMLSQQYQLLINPTIIFGKDLQTRYQECISFPFFDFMIPRYNKLLIHYFDENFKSKFLYTQGFLSRVVQHHVQHLEGRVILDWRVNHGNFSLNKSVQKYFPKSTVVVEEYSKSVKDIIKQFPQLIKTNSQYFLQQQKCQKLMDLILSSSSSSLKSVQNNLDEQPDKSTSLQIKSTIQSVSIGTKKKIQGQTLNEDFRVNTIHTLDTLSFQDDFVLRIVKHFKKQFTKFDQKVNLNLINIDQLNQNKNQAKIMNQNKKNQNKASIQSQYSEQEYKKKIKIKYITHFPKQQKALQPQLPLKINAQEEEIIKMKQTMLKKQQFNIVDQKSQEQKQYEISEQQFDKLMKNRRNRKKKK